MGSASGQGSCSDVHPFPCPASRGHGRDPCGQVYLFPCPFPYLCPYGHVPAPAPALGPDLSHGCGRGLGQYGDEGCGNVLGLGEEAANAYRCATRMKEGSWPTEKRLNENKSNILF